jgi:uncharacterized protein (TIGR02145 family)
MFKVIGLLSISLVMLKQISAQQYGTFKDTRDGRVYKTVKIGNQIWIAENLNTDKFKNGEQIPEAQTAEEWANAANSKKAAWCHYENSLANGMKFGKLYNGYVLDDVRGIAPSGWHIPTKEDLDKLVAFLGKDVGKKMKSASGWKNNETGGNNYIVCPSCKNWSQEYRSKVPCHKCKDTRSILVKTPIISVSGNGNNSSGFGGLAGGFRSKWTRKFNSKDEEGYWFLSSKESDMYLVFNFLYNYDIISLGSLTKENGYSIRLIKD